jgi:CDP-diglyceride synthetase
MKELGKRIIVSVIFIPVLVLALYFEGLPLFLMFLMVSIFGAQEYIYMMRKAEIKIPWPCLRFIRFHIVCGYISRIMGCVSSGWGSL